MISFKSYCLKLIEEGGAYGHLQNIWDVDDFTFNDLYDLIKDSLAGNIEQVSEKTDGQNIMFSYIDELKFARNKTQLKNFGEQSLSVKDFKDKYSQHENKGLAEAWELAADDLNNVFENMNPKILTDLFENGKYWISAEILHPKSENVIQYGVSYIVFHSVIEVDALGNIVSEDVNAVKKFVDDIARYDLDKQKGYTISKPRDLTVKANTNTKHHITELTKELADLLRKYKLKSDVTINDFKKAASEQIIPETVSDELRDALLKRWTKSESITIHQIKKLAGESFDEIKVLDSNIDKTIKTIMLPLEKVFLKLGSYVLQSIDGYLTTDSDKAKKSMKDKFESLINSLEQSDDPKIIEKVSLELDRLKSAGGLDNIIPAEGIVFKYKGKTLKFTGAFAPLNQIMGLRFRMEKN